MTTIAQMKDRVRFALNKLRTDAAGVAWFLLFCAVLGAAGGWAALLVVAAWIKAPALCLFGLCIAAVAWFERVYREPKRDAVKKLSDAFNVLFVVAGHLQELGGDGSLIGSNDEFEIRVYRKPATFGATVPAQEPAQHAPCGECWLSTGSPVCQCGEQSGREG